MSRGRTVNFVFPSDKCLLVVAGGFPFHGFETQGFHDGGDWPDLRILRPERVPRSSFAWAGFLRGDEAFSLRSPSPDFLGRATRSMPSLMCALTPRLQG
jgi:hypothetical protein